MFWLISLGPALNLCARCNAPIVSVHFVFECARANKWAQPSKESLFWDDWYCRIPFWDWFIRKSSFAIGCLRWMTFKLRRNRFFVFPKSVQATLGNVTGKMPPCTVIAVFRESGRLKWDASRLRLLWRLRASLKMLRKMQISPSLMTVVLCEPPDVFLRTFSDFYTNRL